MADIPSHSTVRKPNDGGPAIFIARIVLVAVLWVIASRVTPAYAERFYLIAPWIFAGEAVWMAARGARRKAVRRALTAGGGMALVLAALLIEPSANRQWLPPFEAAIVIYGTLSLLVVARWLWLLTGAPVLRLMGVKPESSLWRRIPGRAAALLVYALVLNAYVLSFLETHWPKRLGNVTPAQVRLTFETVSWSSRDGTRITGWFLPAKGSARTAVVCHGVGADKSDMLGFFRPLHDGGYNILVFDFRGHGASGGHTVSYGAREKWDIITGIDMLHDKYRTAAQHVVGVGWSMGAASLILAAVQDERIEALHIDAAYARTFDIAKVIAAPFPGPFRWTGLPLGTALACLESGTNLFTLAPLAVINRIAPRPIMIIHGEEDVLIPMEQGRLLYAVADEPKHWHAVKGAGHCQTLSVESPRYERRMVDFLDGALDGRPARTSRGAPGNNG